jgi:hypothetical protein
MSKDTNKKASKAIRADIYYYLTKYFPENMKTKKEAGLFVSNTRAWCLVKTVREGFLTLIIKHVEDAKKIYEDQRRAGARNNSGRQKNSERQKKGEKNTFLTNFFL